MSKIAVNSPATGTATFTLTAPGGTSTDRTLTLPDAAGTVALTSDIPTGGADVQTFNSNGTWTKPASGSMARIQVWGGGGGGSRQTGTTNSTGGCGSGYNEITLPLSSLGATVSVTVGAGGAGRTGSAGNGSLGGTTTFGSLVGATGGEGGISGSSAGSAGEALSADLTTVVIRSSPYTAGRGRSSNNLAFQSTVFGGAGGSGADTVAYDNSTARSFLGGSGGAGSRTATAQNGFAPGGGGGGANNDFDGGDGADGRVIVTVW
jgi:hypothetical protein